MQRVLGAQVEVAGEDRRDGVRLGLERVAGIAAGAVVEGMPASLGVVRAKRLDLRRALRLPSSTRGASS